MVHIPYYSKYVLLVCYLLIAFRFYNVLHCFGDVFYFDAYLNDYCMSSSSNDLLILSEKYSYPHLLQYASPRCNSSPTFNDLSRGCSDVTIEPHKYYTDTENANYSMSWQNITRMSSPAMPFFSFDDHTYRSMQIVSFFFCISIAIGAFMMLDKTKYSSFV